MRWDPARLAQPRFAGIADLVARIANEPDWPSIATLNACLGNELATVNVTLVEAGKTKPALGPDGTIDPASLYEVRIIERGEIPTRPRNAHDLCNALVWAAFPRGKLAVSRALAGVQRERAAGRITLPSTRSRAHDRLAMIDEGGVVCVAGAPAWIFGHAIYEHAYLGELHVRGSEIDLVPAGTTRDAIDRALAAADLERVTRRGPGIALDGTAC